MVSSRPCARIGTHRFQPANTIEDAVDDRAQKIGDHSGESLRYVRDSKKHSTKKDSHRPSTDP
jgi:hypothetical protein